MANTKLSQAAPGTVVKLNENGVPVEFYIGTQNYEPTLNGIGRALLIRKDGFLSVKWNNTENNNLAASTIDTFANTEYKAILDPEIQQAIGTTKFPYNNFSGKADTLERAVFMLSVGEMGKTYLYWNKDADGTPLPIADMLPIVTMDGSPVNQHTRTKRAGSDGKVLYASSAGAINETPATTSYVFRPCVTLPAEDWYIGSDGMITKDAEESGGANTPLKDMLPGSIVKTNYNGQSANFVVLHQGKPSPIYDDSFNGGTIMRFESIPENYQWTTTGTNDYAASGVQAHIQEYAQYFDPDIQSSIKTVKIPYRPGAGSSATVNSGANGLECQMYLLSVTELGITQGDVPADGAKLDYYLAGTGADALAKRVANLNGAPARYNTRSPYVNAPATTAAIWEVRAGGNIATIHTGSAFGALTAFVLDANALYVDKDGFLTTESGGTGMFIPASELEQGVEYYFRVYPRNHQNQFQTGIDGSVVTAIPGSAKVMTAVIDLSDSNPATCVSYADDAANIQAGSADWDEFFGHYPCLFKDGAEVGKLNPNDFSKFADGTNADITSGAAGDVMIAFPRRGLKISTSGTKVTVSMTNGASEDGFSYLAHQRGETNKDVFYLGVYKGFVDSGKLRSLSGKTPTVKQYIQTFRTQAQANGAGYEQSAFYQLLFRQCMYILKYKNLNSQQAVGNGYVWAPDGQLIPVQTGATNASGMDWGDKTALTSRVKLFGMEDFWGNVYEFIDGLYINTTWNILTATDGFNDSGTGYTDCGKGASDNQTSGFMQSAQGTAQTGFIPKTFAGSETTYYCDSATFVRGAVPMYGGYFRSNKGAGVFNLNIDVATSSAQNHIGSRLMHL